MKRRDFLATSAAGVAGAGMGLVQGCHPNSNPPVYARPGSFELDEKDLQTIVNDLKLGKYTSEELVHLYVTRILEIDKNGPFLNSVIELNPDAEELAKEADMLRKSLDKAPPLLGIPVLIKDNIDTADKLTTSAGSLALAGLKAGKDAFIAERLRKAGAIILGKTNMSEWANFRSTRSTSGWSGRGGQTRNPYAIDRNPCGSSSGTGVAVSANLCAAGIGTETDGSVVCPSSVNGIVGMKPTLGLWSRNGIIPIAHSQDTAGPMTRTVSDAALLLGLLAGPDVADPATLNSVGHFHTDYTRFLHPGALKNARIGVARSYFGVNPEADRIVEEAIDAMRLQGAITVDIATELTSNDLGQHEMEVLLFEFKHDLNRYLKGCPESLAYRSLADLIAFNEAHADAEMPWFGQELFLQAQEKGGLDDPAYMDALSKMKRLAGEEGLNKILSDYNLEAIVAPTNAPAWVTDLVNGDHYPGGSSSPAACAGYPAITVPAGFVHGLPIGITFMSGAWQEARLISLAFAFEQATRARKAPGFLQSIS